MSDKGNRKGCPFCEFVRLEKFLAEADTFVAKQDLYPVSPGHTLLMPRRHVATLFELDEQERADLFALLLEVREVLDREHNPDGYNIGVNTGRAAGQTVMHLHIHIIPRYVGDVEHPEGGVRGVIPDKARYPTDSVEINTHFWSPINHRE